jgi:hypothetical protein
MYYSNAIHAFSRCPLLATPALAAPLLATTVPIHRAFALNPDQPRSLPSETAAPLATPTEFSIARDGSKP